MQPPIQEQITVPPRRLAGRNQTLAQTQFAAQGQREGLVIEKTIGTDFDSETVALLGTDRTSQPCGLFQDDHFGIGSTLFQPIGEGQSRNPSTDNDDSWHEVIIENEPLRGRGGVAV